MRPPRAVLSDRKDCQTTDAAQSQPRTRLSGRPGEVERLEEKVDDLHENARRLLAKEEKLTVGAAVLMNELYDAVEMVADWCEDACDQVRIIIVRR